MSSAAKSAYDLRNVARPALAVGACSLRCVLQALNVLSFADKEPAEALGLTKRSNQYRLIELQQSRAGSPLQPHGAPWRAAPPTELS